MDVQERRSEMQIAGRRLLSVLGGNFSCRACNCCAVSSKDRAISSVKGSSISFWLSAERTRARWIYRSFAFVCDTTKREVYVERR